MWAVVDGEVTSFGSIPAKLPQVFFPSSTHRTYTLRSLPHHRKDLCLRQTRAVDLSLFWIDGSVRWDGHRVGWGWVIAGACIGVVRVYLSYG